MPFLRFPLSHAALAALSLTWLSVGPTNAEEPSAPASPVPINDVSAAITEEVTSRSANPDDLFQYIEDWNGKRVDEAKLAAAGDQTKAFFQAFMQDKVVHLQPAIDTFLARYPDDPRRWDVKLCRLWFLDTAENIPAQEYTDTYHQIVAAPDASHRAKRRARYMLLLDQFLPQPGPTPAGFAKSDQDMTAFEQDFPDDERGAGLVTERLKWLSAVAPDQIVSVLRRLSASPNTATARAAQDQLSLRTQPLDLSFTSLDGQPINLAELRGKVVLIDFWATWCVPCMAKVPEVLALNRKYAGKDFQLLGVSLDEDRDAARKAATGKGMSWPQTCDGKGWKSELAQRFDVHEIPNVWLVDKKGMAHSLDAEKDDLDARVAELLAEP